MASSKFTTSSILLIMLLGFAILAIDVTDAQGLVPGFYNTSCPEAEDIVRNVTAQYVMSNPSLAASLLRLTFHDCFVRGCDASVLLEPTAANNSTEKTYPPNLSLRGFEVIEAVKEQLEAACPGIVSCADIVQLSGRDAVEVVYGPSWSVLTGRRDGTVSLASEAAEYLPSAYGNITSLKENFAAVGLSVKDLAVLSSAHTIGVSHCASFATRLYNYSGNGDTDPSLDPNYAAFLMQKCPQNYDDQTEVNMDAITPYKFDYKYFVGITQNKGLLESDAALVNDDETNSYLQSQVSTQGSTWVQDFAQSMANMYQLQVLTGNEGEIRQKCGYVNSS
ncbi:Peroxidase 56-like protein [Drosera capensis]